MNTFFRQLFLTFFLALTLLRPALAADDPVQVEMVTDRGSITLELYPEKAPVSVADFLRYVDQGLYEGAAFYRVVRHDNDNGSPLITVIQGGLIDEDAPRLPPIPLERTSETGLTHSDGVISLARSEPDSGGGAAFFICIGDNKALDYGQPRNPDMQGFAAFGKVIDGMDVVRAINAIRDTLATEDAYVSGQMLVEPVMILSVKRL